MSYGIFGVAETVGHAYNDGREHHLVLMGEAKTVCGEFRKEELREDVPDGEPLPLCRDCQNRDRWEQAGA